MLGVRPLFNSYSKGGPSHSFLVRVGQRSVFLQRSYKYISVPEDVFIVVFLRKDRLELSISKRNLVE